MGSTSGDKTAKIWHSDSFRCQTTLGPHSRYVTCGAFSCNLNYFAATFDKYVGIWCLDLAASADCDNIPTKHWSPQQVKLWLGKFGFKKYETQFSKVTGTMLIDFSCRDLQVLGVAKSDVQTILQSIQWVRFGTKAEGFVEDVPDEFLCPLTYDLMVHPVKCSDGFVYEETAIKEWLMTRKNTSPMTNLELDQIELVPCLELKQRIDQFRNSI